LAIIKLRGGEMFKEASIDNKSDKKEKAIIDEKLSRRENIRRIKNASENFAISQLNRFAVANSWWGTLLIVLCPATILIFIFCWTFSEEWALGAIVFGFLGGELVTIGLLLLRERLFKLMKEKYIEIFFKDNTPCREYLLGE
jgi:hypothetical protein